MLCPKRRIHDDRVKLVGVSSWLQRAEVTLDQIHVTNLEFFSISPKYLQGVLVDVKPDAEADRGGRKGRFKKEKTQYKCKYDAERWSLPSIKHRSSHAQDPTATPQISHKFALNIIKSSLDRVKHACCGCRT